MREKSGKRGSSPGFLQIHDRGTQLRKQVYSGTIHCPLRFVMMQFNSLNSSPVNTSLMKKAGNEPCSLLFWFDEIDDSIRILRRGDRSDLGLTFRLPVRCRTYAHLRPDLSQTDGQSVPLPDSIPRHGRDSCTL